MNKEDATLTSPNYGVNAIGYYQDYDDDLNCTWIINADQGYYITLEIKYFDVNLFQINHNDTFISITFLIKVHHSSLVMVTISQYMMDQILNQCK